MPGGKEGRKAHRCEGNWVAASPMDTEEGMDRAMRTNMMHLCTKQPSLLFAINSLEPRYFC